MMRIARSSRRRNLHEERSEETRGRLLEATIESLVAVGYARTSTTEISDRAGVSRGAWIYHYSTKAVETGVERRCVRPISTVLRTSTWRGRSA